MATPVTADHLHAMNLLLRQLQADDVVRHDCIAVAQAEQAQAVLEVAEGRVAFYMGAKVRPGPIWLVRNADAAALEAAGFWRLDVPALIDLSRPPVSVSLSIPGVRYRIRPLGGPWQASGHRYR